MSSIIARAAGAFALFAVLFISIPAVAAAATCGATNCVLNPSFETGTALTFVASSTVTTPPGSGGPTNWTPDWFASSTNPSFQFTYTYPVTGTGGTGTNAAKIDATGITGKGTAADWAFSAVTVTPGQLYTFSDKYLSTVDTEVDVQYTLPVADAISGECNTTTAPAGDTVCSEVLSSSVPASPASFSAFSRTISPPKGTISMIVTHLIDMNGSLTVDDYSVTSGVSAADAFPAGLVSLTFDDGYLDHLTNALPILSAAKMHGTFYVIPDDTTNYTSYIAPDGSYVYLTPAQVTAMQAAGQDMSSHAEHHCDLVALSIDPNSATSTGPQGTPGVGCPDHALAAAITAQTEISNSRTDLATWDGVAGADDNLAYPFGSYNSTVEGLVKGAGFLGARTIDEGYNTKSTDHYALVVQNLDITTSTSTIRGWIDTALANKVWLILVFHQIEPNPATFNDTYAETPATLQDTVNYLAQKQATVLTVSQSLAVLNGGTIPDTIPPIITLNGTSTMKVLVGSTFTDPGATATDNNDSGVISSITPVVTTSFNGAATTSVNTLVVGTYLITYKATDAAGNSASTTRTVVVRTNVPPVAASIATSTFEGVAVPVVLQATDADNDVLTFATTSKPLFGSLTGSGANLIYAPGASTTAFTDLFTYKANDGFADSNIATITITVTPAPNVIPANISSGTPGQNDATITWNTTLAANSKVVYGTDTTYGVVATDTTLTLNHSIPLSGLSAGTTYHFEVVSASSTTSATSTDQTFTTASIPAAPAPVSSGGGGGGGGGGGFSYYGNVQISNGAATTTTQNVTLSLNTNASQVWLSNNASFATGGFVALSSTLPWTLSAGAGQKTVYVRFGVSSSTVASAQANIALADGSAPAPIIASASNTGGVVLGAQTSATCYVFTKSLSIGSTGADVTALQNTLTSLGFYSGPVTGYLGAMTSAGISKFQASKGIDQTGTVGPKTRLALNTCTTGAPAPTTGGSVLGASTGPTTFTETLKVGSTGDQVTALQTKLTTLNDYHGPISGTFGPLTRAGVMQFQTNNGIPATGVVGPLTRAALNAQ